MTSVKGEYEGAGGAFAKAQGRQNDIVYGEMNC